MTVFYDEAITNDRLKHLQARGVACVPVPCYRNRLDWQSILAFIGKAGCHYLWVEAGGICFLSLYESGFMNEKIIYRSSVRLGNAAYPAPDAIHQLEGITLFNGFSEG